jgi:ubiquinone/menaquinone biosynthesis C-methylase UbiE
MISDAEVRRTIDAYIHGSNHQDLVIYRQGISDPAFLEVWLWRMRHLCKLGNYDNKRILEVGCGFGWDAVALSLIGNNQVVAMDILPSMVDGMSQCLDSMSTAGKPLRVTPVQGDVCSLELPDSSFDGIFSSEAIEHVHDLGEMFDNCWRLLRPGGTAVIVNDSNRYNEGARNHSFGSWHDRDESWEHANWLKTEIRPVEHYNTKPYAVVREEIIREAAPELEEASVAKLRAATAGMIRREIKTAVQLHKINGTLPTRPEFSWCRNPETGEYSERLLDPFELVQMLRDRGFIVQLRHLFRKLPYRLFNGIDLPWLNKRLFALRPHFVLVAKKP